MWWILRNVIYVCTLAYGKARYRELGKKRGKIRLPDTEHVIVENAAPAIISRQVWDAAQARHGTRRFGAGRPWHRPYLLSGLIECTHCGKHFQAKRLTRGHVPAVFICSGYVNSGVQFCDSPRIPISYLDEAVIDGIQKRLDLVFVPAEMRRRVVDLLATSEACTAAVPDLEARLQDTRRRIERLVTALAAGTDDLPSVRTALTSLERERTALERELAQSTDRRNLNEQGREQLVITLIDRLAQVRDVLATGPAEERKAVVRTFLDGISIDKANGRARAPVVQAAAGPVVC